MYPQAENVCPQTIRRVAKEVGKLVSAPPEGIKLHVNDEDITDVQATITGPGTFFASISGS